MVQVKKKIILQQIECAKARLTCLTCNDQQENVFEYPIHLRSPKTRNRRKLESRSKKLLPLNFQNVLFFSPCTTFHDDICL